MKINKMQTQKSQNFNFRQKEILTDNPRDQDRLITIGSERKRKLQIDAFALQSASRSFSPILPE